MKEYYKIKNKEFDKEKYINDLIEEKNKIKNKILLGITSSRESYPYFGEPEFTDTNKRLSNRFKKKSENTEQAEKIVSYLESNELEIFYKILPMKDYCTAIEARQNIPQYDLVKTNWFKEKIESIIL